MPCIAVLDSMLGTSKRSEFKIIRKWLNLEAEKLKNYGSGNDELFSAKTMTGYCVKVPRQPNSHDCGCFLLRNVLQFGYDGGFRDTSTKEAFDLSAWYDSDDGVNYRKEIAKHLDQLTQEQEAVIKNLRKRMEEKRKELIRQQIRMRKQKNKK